ncbi:MAG: type VI secretion system-associated FHA domain protein TagH [Gammaproteobacteria bacterium]|nr:type VI secretion system-associated FHA domain protein TagH [Gammaproteobacteria bacterium]
MAITISVVEHNGRAHAEPLVAEFDELGGSIGRGQDNTLVLPDPERHISRTHAVILFRVGRYAIRDNSSSTPVHVNGCALGQGNEHEIGDGDQIVIGVYRLQVAAVGAVNGKDAASIVTSACTEAPVSTKPGVANDNPLASLMDDPFAVSGEDDTLLSGFNPLAVPNQPPAAQPESVWLPNDFDADLGPPTNKSQCIDDLFRLGTVASADPCAPGRPLATARAGTTVRAARPQRNDAPEIHSSFVPPQAKTAPAPAKSKPAVTVNRAPVKPAPPPAAAPAAVPATQDEVLQAFLKGAGVPHLKLPGGLTPQTANMLGALLREATQGTLNLLLSRALVKREVRADRTMIAARENNPLKLSPNVEVALTHLLVPQPGFMLPLPAMRDAHKDLCAHQFGVVAGMRAALSGMLSRFNPKQLAERLTRNNFIESLLPSKRKIRLWDLYEHLYSDVSREAEDDFHTLFGKEFLRAYEAQIEKLEQQDKSAASLK